MDTPRPTSGLPPLPLPDLRSRDVAPDYSGMHGLVAGLVLPGAASMPVKSALETSRELIRHSFYRYEFATVAVTHALYALEQVLAERLASDASLEDLIGRAAAEGLFDADRAAGLERIRAVRDRIARGAVTSGAVTPEGALIMMRTLFDTVDLLLRPSATAEPAPGDMGGAQHHDRLAVLWEAQLRAPYPESFRGVDIDGVELILLDVNVAAVVRRELDGGLDDRCIAHLWACIADLDKVVPLINEEYCVSYFAGLAVLARLVAARYLPAATD
ncbi:hypothetical protein ACFV5G_35530 [Streptomyces sp. NPDC059766]|uniref:hypothetical protein n=1 Tax=Streptomyces sp. NPDC059766 TaxID=3346940 RepID=UPI00365DF52D